MKKIKNNFQEVGVHEHHAPNFLLSYTKWISEQTTNMRTMKPISRIVIFLCAMAMIPSLYMSVWQIQLEAPQYPEGLKLELWSTKIAGDIDKINGLNHYIGMDQIHQENFKEFQVMSYMIWAMIGFAVLGAATGKKIFLWILSAYLIVCGLWGTYDFWHWEYIYGHNLNPHAAIKIPGMAYQPPLFGWKQLLNFTAGSFPDIGGWLVIGPSIMIILILIYEKFIRK
ncbi:MAG: hypothetical protein WCL14_08490 [Bacteroidota bacterium]